MHISKVSCLLSLAGAAALQLQAQPANPELQGKAEELLRQTLSQERQQGNQSIAAPAPAATNSGTSLSSAPMMNSTPPTGTMPTAPASPQQQQQALDLLRQTITAEKAAAASRATSSKTTKAASSKGTQTTSVKQGQSGNATAAAMAPMTSAPAAQPAPPSTGPKTKQERLAELLELYRADKLTPAQYHAERAKILAEP
jgi:hypothetical protein